MPARSGPRLGSHAPDVVTGDAVLFREQLPPVAGAGNQPHAGIVGSHLFVGERQHVEGQRARLLLGEAEIGHGRVARDGIGVQEVALQPIRCPVGSALFSQVGTNAATHAVQLMTTPAPLRFEEPAAIGQLRHAGHFPFFMAAPAGSADVIPGQERLLPEFHLPVRVLLVCGESLSAVADRTAEPGGHVRSQVGVKRVGLRSALHGGVFHPQMTGGAAVYALQTGQQILPDHQGGVQHVRLGRGVGFSHRFQPVELLLVRFPGGGAGLPDGSHHQSQHHQAQRKEELR